MPSGPVLEVGSSLELILNILQCFGDSFQGPIISLVRKGNIADLAKVDKTEVNGHG